MFTKIFGQWLQERSVKQDKIYFDNDQYAQGRNFADTADLNLAKVNANDELEFGILPVYAGLVDGASPNTALTTKAYVLNVLAGIRDPKDAVRVASVGDVDIVVAPASIDSVTLNLGDRILLKNQADPIQNGIYVFDVAGNPLVRSSDADSNAEVTQGMSCMVAEGLVNAHRQYMLTTASPDLGVTALTFVRIPNPADLVIEQQEVLTLDDTDLDTNGYKDLSVAAIHSSIEFHPKGGPIQEKGVDYTVSDVGGVTRLDFGLSGASGSLGEKLKEIKDIYGSVKIIVHYERLAG
jgi:hypothetical protein